MTETPISLQNLHDIVTPDEVSWWPLAPGWIGVAVIVALALGVWVWRRCRAWKAAGYRRAALQQLAAADDVVGICEILRRTALAIAPRETVASLHGPDWVEWLSARCPEPLPPAVAEQLSLSIHQPTPEGQDHRSLREFAAHWIRHHQHPC